MFGPKKLAMIVSEFLGVFVLSLVVYSMIARTSFPLFSGIAAGLTLGVMILAIGKISEAHLNPAVTVGMWVMRKTGTAKALVYIAAQMLGGLAAWWLIKYFIGHSLTSLAGSNFDWHVMIAEILGAAVFGFGVAAALIQKMDPVKCAFVTGASFALGVMAASLASNGILNPAVAVGVQSWDWSYAVGPIIGVIIGSNAYALVSMASTKEPAKSSKKRKK